MASLQQEKITLAKQLAKDYLIVYVDTGAMYRTVLFLRCKTGILLQTILIGQLLFKTYLHTRI
jgi:cytidylate kinase